MASADPPILMRDEWMRRYKQRFIDRAGVTAAQAEAIAESGESFEMLCEFFDDDPEGAADEEMSYWEVD